MYDSCRWDLFLEHVSEFKYFGCALEESGADGAEFSMMVACGRRVAGVIRSLVNVSDLQLECTKVLYERLLVPVLMYASEKEKERSRMRAVQMDNLLGL